MEKTASIKKEEDRIIIRRFDGMEVDLFWVKIDERKDDPEKAEKGAKLLFEKIAFEIDKLITSYVEELRITIAKTQKKIIH